MTRKNIFKSSDPEAKIFILQIFIYLVVAIIGFRLFWLEIVRYEYYSQVAAKEHYGFTQLPARRGDIFIKDYASGEDVRVATNVALDTLFADPFLINDKTKPGNAKLVADRIAPLVFDIDQARADDAKRMDDERKKAKTQQDLDAIKPLSEDDLYKNFYTDFLNKISEDTRQDIILSDNTDQKILDAIRALNLQGIEVVQKQIIAHPDQIQDKPYIASTLAEYIDITASRLEQILEGKNRYVILQKKLKPEVSEKIQSIINDDNNKKEKDRIFEGIGLKEEFYRMYPEGTLAANVLGFVTPDGKGTYGIEEAYDIQLRGKPGAFKTEKDGSVYNRQITVGDSEITPAQDGDSIVLTIDRSLQLAVERKLARAVQDYRADSGQAIVMDPKTGRIMAMAHYPTFDPNNFSSALEMVPAQLSPDDLKNLVPVADQPNAFWVYRNVVADDRYMVYKETEGDGSVIYKRYKNWIGLEAYQNKAVMAPYEPGSVFKTISMAAGIDDKDVTANTAFNDPGTLQVDYNVYTHKYEHTIHNVSPKCTGYVNMTNVIENSCNTGISFVAEKMGRNLFYSYIQKFGFGQRTGIEFANESAGKIPHFSQWAESELDTHAFGQGILVTPLQMISAYATIANNGVMVQPHIIEKVISNDGKTTETDTQVVGTAVSPETAHTITAMLVSAVENGVAHLAQLPNHYVAAKTGTSQTYRHGEPLSGAGTTIASIIGFGPIEDPKFVVYVKLDRPRTSEWADTTSIYAFHDIMAYLFDYFGVPPDKNGIKNTPASSVVD